MNKKKIEYGMLGSTLFCLGFNIWISYNLGERFGSEIGWFGFGLVMSIDGIYLQLKRQYIEGSK